MRPKSTLYSVLLAAGCSAQFLGGQQIGNLILAEQNAINSSIECGRYYDDVVPASIAVRIFGNFTPGNCYNVAETFNPSSYDDDTIESGASDGATSSCDPIRSNCSNPIQAVGLNHYSSTANYSQVQVDIYYSDASLALNQFVVRVFAGEACDENATEPWFSWGGCTADQFDSPCRELPYSVRSFRLERTAGGSNEQCMVAAERGDGALASKVSLAAIVMGVIAASLMAML